MTAGPFHAVVTGGSSGIGAAVAARIVADGGQVLVADIKPPAGDLPYVETDVRDPLAVQAAFDAAQKQLGSVDAAVLCAGIAHTMGQTPETVDYETYKRITGINIDGVVHGIRSAPPLIRTAGGGGIVAIASLAGLTPAVGDPLYSLTKFAIVGLVRTLGPTLAAEGIALNAICPGFVDTPMVDPLRDAFTDAGFPLIKVDVVVDTIITALSLDGGAGECWLIQPGHAPAPYRFRGVPGAVREDGVQPVPAAAEQVTI
jgi:NAD(P)-dependent dehydrogenase (short-subunit alcohol dehydrogenase family)